VSLPLIVSDEAEADLQCASAWYAAQREGLDAEFLLAFESALSRIRRFPNGPAEAIPGVRRQLLRRFPYAVYFVVESDFIKVLAVYHTSRDPSGWQSRIQ
jgi:plasmid stabilization system protein ParE